MQKEQTSLKREADRRNEAAVTQQSDDLCLQSDVRDSHVRAMQEDKEGMAALTEPHAREVIPNTNTTLVDHASTSKRVQGLGEADVDGGYDRPGILHDSLRTHNQTTEAAATLRLRVVAVAHGRGRREATHQSN